VDKIFDFQDIYIELAASAKYRNNLSVVSIAGQFDTAYNEIKTTIPANNRNDTPVSVGSNGVHPSNNGYLQIGDAVYRHMIHRLAE
jgi:lysophospholipase L1-like esterase